MPLSLNSAFESDANFPACLPAWGAHGFEPWLDHLARRNAPAPGHRTGWSGDQACLDRFEALFAQPDLLVVELSASVMERATQLRANHGLRTPDALQAACCLQLGPDAVMITGDAGFQRVQALQVSLITCT